jgi:metal-responsive CopG/Arc/MetJ family transcriptional regulator
VLNSYFEKILLQHFDGIISEEGIMSRPDVLDRACENVIHEVLKDALDRKVGQQ